MFPGKVKFIGLGGWLRFPNSNMHMLSIIECIHVAIPDNSPNLLVRQDLQQFSEKYPISVVSLKVGGLASTLR